MSRTHHVRSKIGRVLVAVIVSGSLPLAAAAGATASATATATNRGAVAVITSNGPAGQAYAGTATFTYVDTTTGQVLGTSQKGSTNGSTVDDCVVAGRTVTAGGFTVGSGTDPAFQVGSLPRPHTSLLGWSVHPDNGGGDHYGYFDVSPDGKHLLITTGLEAEAFNGLTQGVQTVALDGTRRSEVTVNPESADLVAKYTDDGTGAIVGDAFSVRRLAVDPVTGVLSPPTGPGQFIPGRLSALEVAGDLTFVVTNSDSAGGDLFVLRTSDLHQLSETPLPDGASSVVASPDGSTVYVLTRETAAVAYTVDRATGTVTQAWWRKIGTEDGRIYARSTLVITPDGSKLYARNGAGAGITIIDTATQATTAVPVYGTVVGLCMSGPLDNRLPHATLSGDHTGDAAAEPGTARRMDLFTYDPDGDPLAFAWTVDDPSCSFADPAVEDALLTCPTETATTVRVTVSDGYDTVDTSQDVEFAHGDTTAPDIAVTLDGTAGAAGWYVSPVTATWQVSDAESAVATSTGCDTAVVSEPGATLTCAATSEGGTATQTRTVAVDLTDPVVTCSDRPRFSWGAADAAVHATVTDGGSGPASTTASAPVDTSRSGPGTVTVTGSDVAGRTTTVSCGYDVASRYDFVGFATPVDDGLNRAKAGQAVPLKWRLLEASTGAPVVDVSAVRITVTSLPCDGTATADSVQEYAAGASGLQNLGNGHYQLNWKSPTSYAGSCKTLRLAFDDGSVHTARFWFVR